MKQKNIIIISILSLLALILVIKSITIIPAGHKGVLMTFGKVEDKVLSEGMNFKNPITQSVKKFDVRTNKFETKAVSSSKDLQTVTTDIAINYRINNVSALFKNIGADYVDRLIFPSLQEYVKKANAQYTAEELITKRTQVKDAIQLSLSDLLGKNNITLESVFITNFQFSDQFDKAIEAKVTAEQQALKAKNDLDRINIEAQQKISTAKAEAEAIKIQAEAITSQGGADYVKLQAINKWNGILPTTMLPSGSVPFIELNK